MEIPAWLFFSFWALTSITFLHLGFYTLDKTGLSNSVSPVVMTLFKHSLAISSCSSSNYALVFRPQWRCQVECRYLWALFGCLFGLCHIAAEKIDFGGPITLNYPFHFKIDKSFCLGNLLHLLIRLFVELPQVFRNKLMIFTERYFVIASVLFLPSGFIHVYFLIFPLLNLHLIRCANSVAREVQIRIGVHMVVEASLCLVGGKNTIFFPVLAMYVSFLLSAYWAALSGFEPSVSEDLEDERFKALLPVAEKVKRMLLTFKKKKLGKLVGFGIQMMGTLLFQHFFKLTSLNHVVAFLYLAVMWVANLAMLGVSNDSGVLNFLLGNVVVGCTVSQFGLRSTTWFAYGACLLLYVLRLKLESLTLVYGQGEHIQVMLWSDSLMSSLPSRLVNESSHVNNTVVQI